MKILYIEDNSELREMITSLITSESRSVTSCATAEEADVLDKLNKYDVLITDVSLPGMSGTDFAKNLLKASPERVIILCSGYDLKNYPQQWGPNVYTIMKPFEIENLEELLNKIRKSENYK